MSHSVRIAQVLSLAPGEYLWTLVSAEEKTSEPYVLVMPLLYRSETFENEPKNHEQPYLISTNPVCSGSAHLEIHECPHFNR